MGGIYDSSDCPRLTLVVAPMGKLGIGKLLIGIEEEEKNMNYFIIISSRRISIYVADKIIRNETHTHTFYIVPMKHPPF